MTGPPAGPPGPELLLQPPPIIAAHAAAQAMAIDVDHFIAFGIRMVETLSPTPRDRAV
jgi:hypothetical protein